MLYCTLNVIIENKVLFTKNKVIGTTDQKKVSGDKKLNSQYVIKLPNEGFEEGMFTNNNENNIFKWHQKPGHLVCNNMEKKTHSFSWWLYIKDTYLFDGYNSKILILKMSIQHVSEVSKICCDGGGECVSKNLHNWYKQEGIVMDYSIDHTPQHNGKA